jgi:xanthine/CO dehydrogenase XdhC/CoxF family maturation factor
MREIRQIVELQRSEGRGVLMTLVQVTGSSYRRPGAHLLVAGSGAYCGSVSGGCLEAEVLRKAEWLVRDGAAVTRYSTLFDDTGEMPYGLGCGGEVDLLLEPAESAEALAWFAAAAASLGGEQLVAVTLLPDAERPLARIVWDADGRLVYASESLDPATRFAIAEALRKRLPETSATWCEEMLLPGETAARRIYAEPLHPPQRLLLLGAGDDAKPVAAFAAQLGWRVVVADGRSQFARAERFPLAEAVHLLPGDGDPLAALAVAPLDAAVVMTHSFEQDQRLLQSLLRLEFEGHGPRYVGLLGARHRSRLLIAHCAKALGRTAEDCRAHLHVPVGLDLGNDAPESIALAIVAEIEAEIHRRGAGMRTALHQTEMKAEMDATGQPIFCERAR